MGIGVYKVFFMSDDKIKKMYDDVGRDDREVKKGVFYKTEDIPEDFRTEIFGCGNPAFYIDDLKEEDIVLDLGCGAGIDIYLLSRKSQAFFVGVDFSLEMLKRAKKNCEKYGIDAFFVQADIKALPFREDVFTKVVSNACIHLVTQKEKVFSGLTSVMKDKAELVASDIVTKDPWQHNFFRSEFEKTGGIFLYGGIENSDSYFSKLSGCGFDYNVLKRDYFNPAGEVIPKIAAKYPELDENVYDEFTKNTFMLIDYSAVYGKRAWQRACGTCECGRREVFRFYPRISAYSSLMSELEKHRINIIKCSECKRYISPDDSFTVLYPPDAMIVKFPKDWEQWRGVMKSELDELKRQFTVEVVYSDDRFFDKVREMRPGIFKRFLARFL